MSRLDTGSISVYTSFVPSGEMLAGSCQLEDVVSRSSIAPALRLLG